ncbi:Crocetin glucosyltransferase protein [Dioscorea alata]|uniref:Crocetin glucosyltransferase protein n=1 Tax=Dioscorea alata TaxID=55571 RepID=A0ACB7UAI8_DIOAL|nr:Crocetin glucosyltransferase protein [Dioscorea alata]
MAEKKKQHHFLLVASPLQSHINQCFNLAKHLTSSAGAAVTFSITVYGHRRMFPSISEPQQEVNDGLITFKPFSDGFDAHGYQPESMDLKEYLAAFRTNGQRTLSTLVKDLASVGRPVTCIIRAPFLEWVVDVAGEHGVPSVLYWIQAATVFSTHYHFFHGFESVIRAHSGEPSFTIQLPGLQPLQIKDLPSFLTETADNSQNAFFIDSLRELFQVLKRDVAVLMNSFTALETEALASVPQWLKVFVVGSCTLASPGNMFKEDENEYMEWLDTKEEGSVVYISFGSLSVMKKKQIKEMAKGLKDSTRPYLWVVRKDNREKELLEIEGEEGDDQDGNGMMVEWCSQVKVLAHKAVGCFVTHCGWNSTLESLACGKPMVCVPQWTDQRMNAKLVESLWGCGVRSEVDGDGVVKGEELVRCLELVMGDGEKGVEIRRKAKIWKDKVFEAVNEGGSSEVNLRAFVEMFTEQW